MSEPAGDDRRPPVDDAKRDAKGGRDGISAVAGRLESLLGQRRGDLEKSFESFSTDLESKLGELRGAVDSLTGVAKTTGNQVLNEFEVELRRALDDHKNLLVANMNMISSENLQYFRTEVGNLVDEILVGLRKEAGGKLCSECGRLSLLDASYCDMCGVQFETGEEQT